VGVAVAETDGWTPYPHEDVRVHRLWRKRILVGLLLAALFLTWALSLGVTTETEEQVQVYGGGDGSQVSVQRPEEQKEKPAATVTLRPGEVARVNEPIDVAQDGTDRQGQGASVPEPPDGIPFLGIMLLVGPFIVALLAYRHLASSGDVAEANYGVYTGPMPYEMITAGHDDLVRTGERVEQNPFGKRRRDYLRETIEPRRRFRER
jgi:hypothetical protein